MLQSKVILFAIIHLCQLLRKSWKRRVNKPPTKGRRGSETSSAIPKEFDGSTMSSVTCHDIPGKGRTFPCHCKKSAHALRLKLKKRTPRGQAQMFRKVKATIVSRPLIYSQELRRIKDIVHSFGICRTKSSPLTSSQKDDCNSSFANGAQPFMSQVTSSLFRHGRNRFRRWKRFDANAHMIRQSQRALLLTANRVRER